MSNLKKVINSHNSKISHDKLIRDSQDSPNNKIYTCNRAKKFLIPGQCHKTNVIYACTFKANDVPDKGYTGMTKRKASIRIKEHLYSFKNPKLEHCSKASVYAWKLKRQGKDFQTYWEVIEAKCLTPSVKNAASALKNLTISSKGPKSHH